MNRIPQLRISQPRSTKSAAVAAMLAVMIGSTAAIAQTASPAATPAGTPMNFQQVTDKLTTQGYRDVREIERKSDKLFEVKALDSKGQLVELYVDSRSGEVLRQDIKR